jgi:predicted ATP-binding protein involved in virulence
MEMQRKKPDFIEQHKTKTKQVKIENTLNTCIQQFCIENYQGIKKIHIEGIPADTQWIFLTGENGFGKTFILQGIVILLFGNEDNGVILDKKKKIEGFVEFKDKNFTHINKIGNKFFKSFTNFATYGAARLNKNSNTNFPNKTHNLFNTYGDLLDIEDKLIMWEGSDKQKKYYRATREILLKLMSPYVEDLKVERIGSKTDVVYKETESEHYKGFLELASGFRSIIAMVGDMLIRLSEEQPEIENFEELAGIVIIDELDLHLHPKMQREIVERLTNTFKNIQFIVSTHSPIPLLGAPPERTVILNVNRTKEEGITLRRLDDKIYLDELLPNTILTSPIFGFDSIIPETNKSGIQQTNNFYSEVEFKTQNQ